MQQRRVVEATSSADARRRCKNSRCYGTRSSWRQRGQWRLNQIQIGAARFPASREQVELLEDDSLGLRRGRSRRLGLETCQVKFPLLVNNKIPFSFESRDVVFAASGVFFLAALQGLCLLAMRLLNFKVQLSGELVDFPLGPADGPAQWRAKVRAKG